MIVTMAWKSLSAHPIRTAVLGVGFGLGVSVMAILLGVGEVVLDQARAPALDGGGDLLVTGTGARVTSTGFVLESIQRIAGANAVVASPKRRANLFLVTGSGTLPVRAYGGIPSLERALGDAETSGVAGWVDAPADRAWTTPDPAASLRAMDRFHPVPNVPARAASWAEWLYFKGQSGDTQFYLTFLAGGVRPDGRRNVGVRLQLDRSGRVTSFTDRAIVDDAALTEGAPDITVGRSRVTLDGLRYRIALDLPEDGNPARGQVSRVIGDIVIDAPAGRSLPPLTLRGAGGWVTGYVVPVMSGRLSGALRIGTNDLALDGLGYHDHNWGFWEGVSWRWGQVQHEGRSYVYGRVFPPPDAADPERSPAFLAALDADGIVGYASRVTITETDDPATGQPSQIVVRGRRATLDLTMTLDIERAIVTPGGALAEGPDFLQLRAKYHVVGEAGGQPVDFTAFGAAETFRGR